MGEQLLKIEEVALLTGVSAHTIEIWYRWKRQNLDHEYAKMLPNYIQKGARQTRYWKKSDIWSLVEFKNTIPRGRNGILGEITQKHHRKKENKIEQSRV